MKIKLSLALVLLTAASSSTLLAGRVLPGCRTAEMARVAPVGDFDPGATLHLAIGMPLRDPVAFNQRLAAMHDPTRPEHSHPLTPAQFAEQYAPTTAQYQAAMDYATAHGLTVTGMYGDRLVFDVSGSVADIEKVFHVHIRRYHHPKEARDFYGPDGDPSVDAEFPILDVSGLDNFTTPRPADSRLTALDTNTTVTPNDDVTGSATSGLLSASDLRNAYAPGVTLNGQGQYVGLFEFGGYNPADVAAFAQESGLPQANVVNVSVDNFNFTDTGTDDGEVAGDIEMVMSIAPAATILVYSGAGGANAEDILARMASDGLAKQMSCSWTWSPAPVATVQNLLDSMYSQGQSMMFASGDFGADTNGFTGGTGSGGAPGGCTNIIYVGGTVLDMNGRNGPWGSETAWSGSGGGHLLTALPPFQEGVSMTLNHGSTTLQDFPDVAAAATGIGVYINGAVADGGGTSYAAPLWAGFLALASEQAPDSAAPPPSGLLDAIYNIGKGSQYAGAFHDITSGNTTNTNSPANYYAVTGYDLCTGWGSPTGSNLISLLVPPADALVISPGYGFSDTVIYGRAVPGTNITLYPSLGPGTFAEWFTGADVPWLSSSIRAGSVGGGAPIFPPVISLVPSAVSNLPPGTYNGHMWFTNVYDNVVQSRLFVLNVSAAAQPLALNGFNASLVVPTGASISQPDAISFGNNSGWYFYASGFANGPQGMPVGGQFVSECDGSTVFQLGPYGANDALYLGAPYAASNTLTLASPQTAAALVILAASASSTSTATGTLVVNFADGSQSQPFSFNAQDWFTVTPNMALGSLGRLNIPEQQFETTSSGGGPYLNQTVINLAALGYSSAVKSISFTMPGSTANTAIFAVSAVTGSASSLKPAIAQQPGSLASGPNPAAMIKVAATGAGPLSYQWYSNSIPIFGSLGPDLFINAGSNSLAGANFYVVVSNAYGAVTSSTATVNIYAAPVATQTLGEPSYLLAAGRNVTFGVFLTGATPMGYTWCFNGERISWQAASTNDLQLNFTLSNAQASNAGSYTFVATNVFGSVTTAPVVVNVESNFPVFPNTVLALNPLGYWRLDESSGNTAYDIYNGNNGAYSNASLGEPGYGSAGGVDGDPAELAAQFGPNGAQSHVSIPNMNLSEPVNFDGEFSVSAWVKGSGAVVSNGAGIFTEGDGAGDEEFCLDCGGTSNGFRFFVRDAFTGTAYGASSSIVPDNNWHWLVGVCDQGGGTVFLYVDGALVAGSGITPTFGIHFTTAPASIGARTSGPGQPYNLQWLGLIDDAAIFTAPLSAAQISSIYNEAKFSPIITQQPAAFLRGAAGTSGALTVSATGPGISYKWYGPSGVIPGAVNSTLEFASFAQSQTGTYYAIVSNAYFTVQSSNAVVEVLAPANTAYPRAILAFNPLAYWRLDETNGGIAYDFANFNNGSYSNAVLGQSGYGSAGGTGTDPSELAAQFGPDNSQSFVSIPTIDLSTSQNGEFTITAWVKGSNTIDTDAGIVTKGAGGGDEQFDLDCGGPAHGFRFFVRDSVNAHGWLATSSVPPDNHWHLLAGVCDQANGSVFLYVDGTNAAQGPITAGIGIHETSIPASIGAREGGTGQPYNFQFLGAIDDVAIFTNAFTASQISALYKTALEAITPPPLSASHSGGNLVITWPTNATAGLLLQQTSTLSPANWINATNSVTTNTHSQYQVTITPSAQNEFFRLSTQ